MLRVVAGTLICVVFYFVLPQVLCYNITMAVNSASHMWGEQPYHDAMSRPCRSKNNALMWIFMLGENWHNNHHAFPYSATTQINWYEVDLQFAVYKLLEALSLAWRHKEKALCPAAMDYQRVEGHRANAHFQVLQLGIAVLTLTVTGWGLFGRRTSNSSAGRDPKADELPYTKVETNDLETAARNTGEGQSSAQTSIRCCAETEGDGGDLFDPVG
eukprot:TRINITY_DN18738_c0_g1_i1.p2 TRINITY_DN18738_c0_g1~~TRINITY_DN18738_c0_g1_i1.p2  ORF type:complete len:215 (+),score=27.36 TRINITY_DN18738_c0_g1_i1:707-1351(+)